MDIKVSTQNAEIRKRMYSVNEFSAANTRMMIVDDDSDLRMILDDYFEKRGFNVVSLRSGAEAVEMLSSKKSQFDIVLTDLVMPGIDGMDVLSAARQHNPLVHVVVMTGYSSLKTAIESIRCGAFDYLAKPFQLVEIEIVVNRIIEHQRLAAENQRLNRKLSLLSEQTRSVDCRLDTIESLLSTLVANLDRSDKALTPLDI